MLLCFADGSVWIWRKLIVFTRPIFFPSRASLSMLFVWLQPARECVSVWQRWRAEDFGGCLGRGCRALSLNAAGPQGWTLALRVSFNVRQDKLFCYWMTKNKKNKTKKTLWPWLTTDDGVERRGDESESLCPCVLFEKRKGRRVSGKDSEMRRISKTCEVSYLGYRMSIFYLTFRSRHWSQSQ